MECDSLWGAASVRPGTQTGRVCKLPTQHSQPVALICLHGCCCNTHTHTCTSVSVCKQRVTHTQSSLHTCKQTLTVDANTLSLCTLHTHTHTLQIDKEQPPLWAVGRYLLTRGPEQPWCIFMSECVTLWSHTVVVALSSAESILTKSLWKCRRAPKRWPVAMTTAQAQRPANKQLFRDTHQHPL